MNNLELCNGLRSELEGVSSTGFPLDVFPPAVQKIILDLVQHDGQNVELLSAAMLSAAATAIGNAFMIHIRGNWKTNCSLFIILVARPGTGKTPALSVAFAPIRKRDAELARRFKSELDAYTNDSAENGKGSSEKPHIKQFILDDCTPEALFRAHFYNQRGEAIVSDEFLGFLKTINRYSSDGKIIEVLLSAWTGSQLVYTRKDEGMSYIIANPCINLIGGIQTNLVHELFKPELTSNGFTDRLVFVCPEVQEVPRWTLSEEADGCGALARWHEILDRIMDIRCEYEDDSLQIRPKVLEMSPEARSFFYRWNNEIVDSINGITDEDMLDTHVMKLNSILPRLALTIQVLGWACGSSHIDCIDESTMSGAKRLLDYFEGKYCYVKNFCVLSETRDVHDEWYDSLPDSFDTDLALASWLRVGMKRRSIFYYLKKLCTLKKPLLRKVEKGRYEKVRYED